MKKIILFLFVSLFFAAFVNAQPQHYNYTTGSGNTFPLGQTAGKFVNWLFPPGAFNMPTPCPPGQQITTIYIRMYGTGTRAYTNLHILMAQTTLTNLTTGTFYPGPWDTVYVKDTSLTSGGADTWLPIQLHTPFPYNPTEGLVVGIGQCAGAGSGMYVLQTSVSGIKRTWSVGGCPFTPYAGGDAYNLNMGIDVESTLPSTPAHYNYMTTGSNNSFPFGIAGGKMVQWLIPPAAMTGGWHTPTAPTYGGMIDGIYVWVGGTYPLGPTTYTNFEILMGKTSLTSLTTGQFYNGPMDTVYYRASIQLQGSLNSWMPIALDTPFPYDPDSSLVLQIGQCGASGVTGYPACQTNIGSIHRVWSVGGCPFTPYSTSDGYVIHTGININYPTGVSHNNNNIPGTYRLEQNYPNPFNPVTNISYSIPKAGNVKLAVYDVLGREIASLVNEYKTAGNYSVSFNAENLASGVYVYRIESGDFTDVKKMMLVK
jgi:Ni,Fe-hydrogenase III small subunit